MRRQTLSAAARCQGARLVPPSPSPALACVLVSAFSSRPWPWSIERKDDRAPNRRSNGKGTGRKDKEKWRICKTPPFLWFVSNRSLSIQSHIYFLGFYFPIELYAGQTEHGAFTHQDVQLPYQVPRSISVVGCLRNLSVFQHSFSACCFWFLCSSSNLCRSRKLKSFSTAAISTKSMSSAAMTSKSPPTTITPSCRSTFANFLTSLQSHFHLNNLAFTYRTSRLLCPFRKTFQLSSRILSGSLHLLFLFS